MIPGFHRTKKSEKAWELKLFPRIYQPRLLARIDVVRDKSIPVNLFTNRMTSSFDRECVCEFGPNCKKSSVRCPALQLYLYFNCRNIAQDEPNHNLELCRDAQMTQSLGILLVVIKIYRVRAWLNKPYPALRYLRTLCIMTRSPF